MSQIIIKQSSFNAIFSALEELSKNKENEPILNQLATSLCETYVFARPGPYTQDTEWLLHEAKQSIEFSKEMLVYQCFEREQFIEEYPELRYPSELWYNICENVLIEIQKGVNPLLELTKQIIEDTIRNKETAN